MKGKLKRTFLQYKFLLFLPMLIVYVCLYDVKICLETKQVGEYEINPGEALCGKSFGSEFLFVSFTPITVNLFQTRRTIRNSWINQSFKNASKSIFIVGKSTNESINNKVKLESQMYGDILQGDFVDTYRNLVKKTILGIKWMLEYCNKTKFILKIDDDMVMNTKQAHSYFLSLTKQNSSFLRRKIYGRCNHTFMRPIRDPKIKQYISREDYAPDRWDPYCHGPAYALTTDILEPLYNLTKYVKEYPMEDCYVGTLAKHLNYDLVDVKRWMIQFDKEKYSAKELNYLKTVQNYSFLLINNVKSKRKHFYTQLFEGFLKL